MEHHPQIRLLTNWLEPFPMMPCKRLHFIGNWMSDTQTHTQPHAHRLSSSMPTVVACSYQQSKHTHTVWPWMCSTAVWMTIGCHSCTKNVKVTLEMILFFSFHVLLMQTDFICIVLETIPFFILLIPNSAFSFLLQNSALFLKKHLSRNIKAFTYKWNQHVVCHF